jgi:hypothetical protein
MSSAKVSTFAEICKKNVGQFGKLNIFLLEKGRNATRPTLNETIRTITAKHQ